MSFEGFEQVLCEKGHLDTYDCYDFESIIQEGDPGCLVCGSPLVWWNTVDQTNGLDENSGFIELEEITAVSICVCNCGDAHIKVAPTYKIPPKDVGHHLK